MCSFNTISGIPNCEVNALAVLVFLVMSVRKVFKTPQLSSFNECTVHYGKTNTGTVVTNCICND